MQLNKLNAPNFDYNESDASLALIAGKPSSAMIKPAWKSSRLFLEPHSVTYVSTRPTDKFSFILIALFLHGIAIFMPWNMFITAESYFRDYKLNIRNASDETIDHQKYFLSYFSIAAILPSLIAMAFNIFLPISSSASITRRITISIIIQAIIIVITTIMAIIDTSELPQLFFYVTLLLTAILMLANGMHQNCIYGITAYLPSNYSTVLVFGACISGFLMSIFNLTVKVIWDTVRLSSIYYFVTSLFILLICFDCYYALSISRFYRYFKRRSKLDLNLSEDSNTHNKTKPSIINLSRNCWEQCVNLYLIYLVTYSIFPALQVNIKPNSESSYFLPQKYFTLVTCYVVFNCGSSVGSFIPLCVDKKPSPKSLWIFIALRFVFLPLFVFSNLMPDTRQWPIYLFNDYVYVVLSFTLGCTNGYFTSLCVMYASVDVKRNYSLLTGMIASFFITFGIFSGIIVSYLLLLLIEIKII